MVIPLRPMYMNLLCVIAACAFAYPLRAQPAPLDRAAVSLLVDAVLDELLPEGKRLSRVPIAQRGIFFDHERTLAAFGYPGAPPLPLSGLRLRATVNPGSETLLDDCDQLMRGPCNQLGWAVYVRIAPVSVTPSEARVHASIVWPERGSTVFEEGVVPSGRAGLVGFTADLYFARLADGSWKLVKQGPTAVSE
ncbi:MAG: hypothetical protein NUW01_17160 [Gemmatimonadaceae bacterium]|nr:hypothetical protein [Gemmatimonadaceae bacterium]